jgi:hypothetical protein
MILNPHKQQPETGSYCDNEPPELGGELKAPDETDSLYDPQSKSRVPIRDREESTLEISDSAPPSAEEIEGFRQHRSQLTQVVNAVADPRCVSFPFPPPGGVGSGVFFRDGVFSFENETAIYWHIVAPQLLGGNPHAPLLYLTSSNHASMGCEGLVSYRDGEAAVFRVWDWASPVQESGSQFVIGLPFDKWGEYLVPFQVNGQDTATLYLVNRTSRRDGDTWQNDIFLFNQQHQIFDRLRNFQFTWTPTEQDKFFGWGPIVETFAPKDYGVTNMLGYARAILLQDGQENLLTPDNSVIQCRKGFEITHLTPNFTLLAQSQA